jgi:hypothetical protein
VSVSQSDLDETAAMAPKAIQKRRLWIRLLIGL